MCLNFLNFDKNKIGWTSLGLKLHVKCRLMLGAPSIIAGALSIFF